MYSKKKRKKKVKTSVGGDDSTRKIRAKLENLLITLRM
jgi:hypothetical protein